MQMWGIVCFQTNSSFPVGILLVPALLHAHGEIKAAVEERG